MVCLLLGLFSNQSIDYNQCFSPPVEVITWEKFPKCPGEFSSSNFNKCVPISGLVWERTWSGLSSYQFQNYIYYIHGYNKNLGKQVALYNYYIYHIHGYNKNLGKQVALQYITFSESFYKQKNKTTQFQLHFTGYIYCICFIIMIPF